VLTVSVVALRLALWLIGLTLQYLALSALLRGKWRVYPLVFAYVALLLATTIVDIGVYFTSSSRIWAIYYWCAELVRQTAMYAVVISLAIKSLPYGRSRPALVRLALAFAIAFYSLSMALEYRPVLNEWMMTVVRNLSFGSAVANLGLWFYLIHGDRRDITTLMLAGGLGLQMTGEAVGQSIRHLVPAQAFAASMLIVASHFLCMLIWWQALQRPGPNGAEGHAHMALH
jgi:hypothetical protein